MISSSLVVSIHGDSGTEGGAVPRNIGQVDHGELAHAFLQLAQARIDEYLALFGHVVLGVLAQIAERRGLS